MEHGPVRQLRGEAVSTYKLGREMEARNLPVVLNGGVENWPAMLLWDPARGGLDHLKSLAGSSIVQAITSNSGSAFYGHIKGHDRVAISFGSFINHIISGSERTIDCGSRPPKASEVNDVVTEPLSSSPTEIGEADVKWTEWEGEELLKDRPLNVQFYLAQVPVFSKGGVGEMPLSPLMRDIAMPLFLKTDRVSDINLWMSTDDSRSSTHYDPYHNLLCVVAGKKKVALWPPSAAPFLYPLPIHGEASNHRTRLRTLWLQFKCQNVVRQLLFVVELDIKTGDCSGVDFVQPDYVTHPLFQKALCMAKLVILHPGDALFIPEGWYHQVDNFGVTIAVNFWWPSKVSLALGTHMDAYYLRRVIVSLLDREKECILRDEMEDSARLMKSRQPSVTETHNLMPEKCSLDRCPEHHSEGNVKCSEGDILEDFDLYEEKLDQKTDKAKAFVTLAHPGQSSPRTGGFHKQRVSRQGAHSCSLPASEQESCDLGITSMSNISRSQHDHGEILMQSGDQSQELKTEDLSHKQFRETVTEADSGFNKSPKQLLKLEDLTALEACYLKFLMTSLQRKAIGSPHIVPDACQSARRLEYGRQESIHSDAFGFSDGYHQDNLQSQEDSVARVFSALKPASLQRILLVMVNQFPRTLQTLVMTSLSPSAAEVLTRKFEELDASTEQTSQAEFYAQFYSAFDSPQEVMAALLDGKEAFAAQALRKVMTQFLGTSCDPSSR